MNEPPSSAHASVDPGTPEDELDGAPDDILPWRSYQEARVVGLGGSAGSIPALQRFFEAMPERTGMAFVVVLHLSPEHESVLSYVLQRSTKMPVRQAQDGEKIEVDHV